MKPDDDEIRQKAAKSKKQLSKEEQAAIKLINKIGTWILIIMVISSLASVGLHYIKMKILEKRVIKTVDQVFQSLKDNK